MFDERLPLLLELQRAAKTLEERFGKCECLFFFLIPCGIEIKPNSETEVFHFTCQDRDQTE